MPDKIKVAVLISGSGRTLKNLLDLSLRGTLPIEIKLVVSSSPAAGGLAYAAADNVPTAIFERKSFKSADDYGDAIFGTCLEAGVDYVVMAGFLKLATVPNDFEHRVVNIHPSLIPAFCGHGMYGHHVHQAVLDFGAKVTGVTVHFVDNVYDNGPIIWQQPVPVFDDDTADTLAARVFETEKEAYPHVLRQLAAGNITIEGRRVRVKPQRREREVEF